MLVHHSLSLLGIIFSTFMCKWGTELVAVLAAAEVTNPILQTRWFLRNSGYSDHYITSVVDWTFISLFAVFRIILGGAQLFVYFKNPKPDFLGRFGGVSIYTLNIVFMYYIGGYAYRKYFLKFKRQAAESSQNGICPASNGSIPSHKSNGYSNTAALTTNGHAKLA